MVDSYECAVTNLYTEITNKHSVDLDFKAIHGIDSSDTSLENGNFVPNEGFLVGFPWRTEETLDSLFWRERDYLPFSDYMQRLQDGDLDLSFRRDAIEWIWKAYTHYSFGPSTVCFSINYLDRFLSVYELPKGKCWTVQLLAVACLSLAAKMEETTVPHPVDLQVGEPKYVFEGKTIYRMELLVLSTLKWRMYAITPFSFISFFLVNMNGGRCPSKPCISRALELILSTTRGVDCLEFKPSEVAAAIAIYILKEISAVDDEKAEFWLKNVDKGRVKKCVEVIKEVSMGSGNDSVSCVPKSPDGVLEGGCFSYKSEDWTVGSCANSSQNDESNNNNNNNNAIIESKKEDEEAN